MNDTIDGNISDKASHNKKKMFTSFKKIRKIWFSKSSSSYNEHRVILTSSATRDININLSMDT